MSATLYLAICFRFEALASKTSNSEFVVSANTVAARDHRGVVSLPALACPHRLARFGIQPKN